MFLGKLFFVFPRLALGVVGCWWMIFGGPALRAASAIEPIPAVALTKSDNQLLDDIERSAFQFFVEQAHPRTGLVRDRARADGSPSEGKASVSVSGFALSAWVVATERGWVGRPEALKRVRHTLQFLAKDVTRRHGFFYHFLEMDTGARAWQCELSSVDTSLLLAGAIVAREYFNDREITRLVNGLLGDLDWAWFSNQGKQVSLSWHDETGFSRYRWKKYSEHVLMSFLALGSSPRPLDADYWSSWDRKPIGRYGNFIYMQEPPLFVHQFAQVYIDMHERRDAYVDYFRNSQLATLAQRQFCIDLRTEFPSWGENLWGVTASDSATGYKAWGGPPRTWSFNTLDGTIVPCAAAGSLPFAPRETLTVLHHLKLAYGDRIWRRYGFVDAFNPETGWVNSDVLGIDQGITMLQAENLRTGLIQRLFMQSPEAQLAIGKAGLLSTSRTLATGQQQQLLKGAAAAWHTLLAMPSGPGLQLTALLAAHQLGFVSGAECITQMQALLTTAVTPTDADGAARFAAGLIAVRQALPSLQKLATQRLNAIPWADLSLTSAQLGSAARLTVFFQIAARARPVEAWLNLQRTSQPEGTVHILAPASPAGLLLPGLWLDEHAIVTGASASQLAYARLLAAGATGHPVDAMTLALLLDGFPVETMQRFGSMLGSVAVTQSAPDDQAALLVTAANLLGSNCVRQWFQQDPLVIAGRAAIPEFGEAVFGSNTSLIAQRELAAPVVQMLPRRAEAAAVGVPRERWDWQTVSGLEFKDSDADILPGDAPLELRFAFTWDATALHFHAEVKDSPAGFVLPPVRNRAIFLFVNPGRDGLVWAGPRDFKFSYKVGVPAHELFNRVPTQAEIIPTETGYTVEASIPWTSIGLTPQAGLEFDLSPAVVSEGVREWDAMLQLIWSSRKDAEGRSHLGVLHLQ